MLRRKLMCLIVPLALLACAEARDEQIATDTLATTTEAGLPAESSNAMLDPNTATAEQLATVPNLDAAGADAIVQGRPYADMRAVNAVLAGLTDEQRDSVYTRVWKPIDLNTATPEEMELIPGVGPRMRHEFEEYRPWTSIEQFRREIGKYVDEAEVARLERYLAVPTTS
jgi:DNA uptake protein ComE-like DNA-binding protein